MSGNSQNGEKTANGASVVNGSSHAGSTALADVGEKIASRAKPKPTFQKPKPTKADRQGVANALERYSQFIHATVQPLPNQGGAGTFSEAKKWGKLRADIKTLRSAGTWGVVEREREGVRATDAYGQITRPSRAWSWQKSKARSWPTTRL